MQPLIDADIFLYEIGFAGQYKNESTGETEYRDFDWVADLLDQKIDSICKAVGATMPPKLFLTGIQYYWKDEYVPNFREAIATKKKYKGQRKNAKPFHYYNLYHHIAANYDTVVSNGVEADDLLGVAQTSAPHDTIICTRDKDLRMIEGWHYGWECGLQPEFKPKKYSNIGEIELVRKYNKAGKCTKAEIKGGGKAFFFAQCLVGDVVDNIGGLESVGPVKAYDILASCETEGQYFAAVKQCYIDQVGEENWEEAFMEQARLVWIGRELDEKGGVVPYGYEIHTS